MGCSVKRQPILKLDFFLKDNELCSQSAHFKCLALNKEM